MKKLLLFTLILGLFAGCKKDSTPEAPCYVGTWEGSVVNPDDAASASVYYESPPTLILYDNNTGVARFTVKSTSTSYFAGNKVGVGFTYTVSIDNKFSVNSIISSTLTIGSGEPVTQTKGTSGILGQDLWVGTAFSTTCQSNKLTINVPPNLGILKYTGWTRKP